MKTKLIIAFSLGIVVTVFSYHAYMVYTLRAAVVSQGQAISQIVTYLNGQVKK